MGNFIATDHKVIFFQKWETDKMPIAVVQIFHGMAEHGGCYNELAAYLNEAGIAVFASDHRGHGKTIKSDQEYGHIDANTGWNTILDDLHQLNQKIRYDYSDIPIFIYGHSMGSFLARAYITKWGNEIDGVILSATNGHQAILNWMAKKLANWECGKYGALHRSKRLSDMSFGSYNKNFTPNRTAFDWLSRDEKKVDAYIADPRCGGTFSSGFFSALLHGIDSIYDPTNIKHIPRDMSFLFLTGERDPINGFASRIWSAIDTYERFGLFDVEAIFYPKCRHDLKLELNREVIFKDIVTWINGKLKEWKK